MSQNSAHNKSQVTALLKAWQAGEPGADVQLDRIVHAELDRLARGYMQAERGSHTLQPTALVNEAWLRLVDADLAIDDRKHFYALAARTMRRILVDHARAKNRQKRGDGQLAVTLHESIVGGADNLTNMLELDEALQHLATQDPRLCEAIDLVYFGGLSYADAASVLGISRTTLGDELKFAKAWLKKAMTPPER